MTSFRKYILIVMASFLLMACNQSKKDPISRLQEQLKEDSVTLCEIQRKYPDNIEKNFRWCDSMLVYIPEEEIPYYFDVLDLAQAYLNQFKELLPLMQHELSYTRQQLTNLKNDIETHFINDSLANIYLADETAVADTLHNRILYFQDRLSNQDKELQSLRKTISKAALR